MYTGETFHEDGRAGTQERQEARDCARKPSFSSVLRGQGAILLETETDLGYSVIHSRFLQKNTRG